MKIFGRCEVRKYRDTKNGEKYITLDISLNFFSMDKMKITSSEPKDYLRISIKGLIASLCLKTFGRLKKNKSSIYSINNVSMKDISKISKEFEKLPYNCYVRKRSKEEPTDSYFYLATHLDKCMMRAVVFNLQVDLVRTKMIGTQQIPSSQVFN